MSNESITCYGKFYSREGLSFSSDRMSRSEPADGQEVLDAEAPWHRDQITQKFILSECTPAVQFKESLFPSSQSCHETSVFHDVMNMSSFAVVGKGLPPSLKFALCLSPMTARLLIFFIKSQKA